MAALAIFAVVLGAFTGGALTAALMSSGAAGATGAAFTAVGFSGAGITTGAIAGAGLDAAATIMVDTGCFGACGSGLSASEPYAAGDGSGVGILGGIGTAGSNMNITTFNFNDYLTALQSTNYTSGTSGESAQSNTPTNPSTGASGIVGALTNAATSNQLEAPGSIGSQANTSANNADAGNPSQPDSLNQQYMNGAPTNMFGALPPAP